MITALIFCPVCGRSRIPAPGGVLPPHSNLALLPCAGSGRAPASMPAPSLPAQIPAAASGPQDGGQL